MIPYGHNLKWIRKNRCEQAHIQRMMIQNEIMNVKTLMILCEENQEQILKILYDLIHIERLLIQYEGMIA
jgi:hypothetical protein